MHAVSSGGGERPDFCSEFRKFRPGGSGRARKRRRRVIVDSESDSDGEEETQAVGAEAGASVQATLAAGRLVAGSGEGGGGGSAEGSAPKVLPPSETSSLPQVRAEPTATDLGGGSRYELPPVESLRGSGRFGQPATGVRDHPLLHST